MLLRISLKAHDPYYLPRWAGDKLQVVLLAILLRNSVHRPRTHNAFHSSYQDVSRHWPFTGEDSVLPF